MSNFFWLMAAIPCAALIGLAVHGFVRSYSLHKQREPVIDYDAMQMELDEEFAPLPIEQASRLSA
ncbi:hypothetical protein [Pararhizobium antarcticum]|uniref:Uncharacterized protein n=1 Tax=Pararhizobium antarcticum TaxID=1798805 RepID=A0A657LU86_9HYPH|nr:hypothetical protein [Pararhizobium antarcticum]OJF97597.1 hypothetical protein AX760_16685 [Pararhizobium antarcticum]